MGSSDITNVYAALDRTHTVVALERSRRGDEGFRTFFDEFADYAANKGYIPYLLLLNFHVDDSSRLPPIEAKERGYRLAHLAPLEVKDIRQALTLYDLLYCRKHGLDPLAAQNTARNLCYKDDYAGFRNESIPALSQPGAPYRAVETEGGVALFRRGERGDEAARSFFAFLTAHPDGRGLTCGVETLRIYDVELSEEQYSSEACLPYFDHEQMRFVPRHSGRCDSVLQRGCCLKEYDMRAGAAKLAAAALYATALFAAGAAIVCGVSLAFYGAGGADLTIQNYALASPYNLTMAQAAALYIGIFYLVMLGMLALTLALSASTPSTLSLIHI